MGHVWTIFQPLLFGLIGAEVRLELIELSAAGMGLAVLGIGLLFRIAATFFVVFRMGLTLKEKLFVTVAWIPKATVQVISSM
jgi:solute carrier family 9B (sodium/hydrogen exchanger), member 1/2